MFKKRKLFLRCQIKMRVQKNFDFIVICFENCHETITFTNKPQNFVIYLNLTESCALVHLKAVFSPVCKLYLTLS